MKRLALLLIVAACADKKPATPPAPPAALPTQPPVQAAAFAIPATTKLLITGVVDDWAATNVTLRVWRRDGATWTAQGDAWPAVVGRTGVAWGIGLHGEGAPGREGPLKKEGDGKSPAGAFAIRQAFGVAGEPPKGTTWPYESTKGGDYQCVDDPASDHYATIVDRKQVASDWQSHEEMLRPDQLYTWVVDIAHNPDHVRGKGSCIFFHVWGGKDTTTVGCTAMEEPRLTKLITQLDPADNPIYVLLPRADYSALAPAWGLPPL
ncbi:MAG TPA: L,D-transpeptidase family protein [Kofleriaceae bacterium]|nr:L,D-transpeptidase family protein [Kofleriaceae bacterium]